MAIRKIEADKGENIHSFLTEVLRKAWRDHEVLIGVFNEIETEVHPDSYIGDLCTIHVLQHEMRRMQR
jgi:hypothetical protein